MNDCFVKRTVAVLKKHINNKNCENVIRIINLECLFRELIYVYDSTCKNCELNGGNICNDSIVGNMLQGLR